MYPRSTKLETRFMYLLIDTSTADSSEMECPNCCWVLRWDAHIFTVWNFSSPGIMKERGVVIYVCIYVCVSVRVCVCNKPRKTQEQIILRLRILCTVHLPSIIMIIIISSIFHLFSPLPPSQWSSTTPKPVRVCVKNQSASSPGWSELKHIGYIAVHHSMKEKKKGNKRKHIAPCLPRSRKLNQPTYSIVKKKKLRCDDKWRCRDPGDAV